MYSMLFLHDFQSVWLFHHCWNLCLLAGSFKNIGGLVAYTWMYAVRILNLSVNDAIGLIIVGV